MAKQLEINGYEAHIMVAAINNLLEDGFRDAPDDDPHKNRLITVRQKIYLLYPEA